IKLDDWAAANYKKYNSALRNMKFYLSPRYWGALAGSGAKLNYVSQAGELFREFMNQKFRDQY
ncbi:MAG: hypothetical protein ABH825_00145, partial [Candidatus Omnitrophota bacterium]